MTELNDARWVNGDRLHGERPFLASKRGHYAAGRQMLAPEGVQPEFLVENIGQPASAPLPRAAQLQLIQTNADDVVVIDCGSTFLGKERDGASPG